MLVRRELGISPMARVHGNGGPPCLGLKQLIFEALDIIQPASLCKQFAGVETAATFQRSTLLCSLG